MRGLVQRTLSALLLALLIAAPSRAQDPEDIGDVLEAVGGDYATLYIQPLVDAFGADINSGLFHSASISSGLFPFVDAYVGVKAFGAFVPAEDQTLSLDYNRTEVFEVDGREYEIPLNYTIQDAPTVFGRRQAGQATIHVDTTVMVNGQERHINEERTFDILPGLVNTRFAPLIVPQVGIGSSLIGTELTVRYLPEIGVADYGSVNMLGLGVRHDIGQYIPMLPVALSTQVMYQTLGIEDANDNDVVSATAWAGNVAVSKSLLLLTVYGGLQVERTTVDVAYRLDPPDDRLPSAEIDLGLEGVNTFRALAGVNLSLGLFNLHADYSVGQRDVVTAGVNIVL